MSDDTYIVAESPDGMRVGMSADTFQDHYVSAGWRATASVDDKGAEHPRAEIVKQLNSVQSDAPKVAPVDAFAKKE